MVRIPISQGTASVRESLAEDGQQAPHISRAVPYPWVHMLSTGSEGGEEQGTSLGKEALLLQLHLPKLTVRCWVQPCL